MFEEKTFLKFITYAPFAVIPIFFIVVTILSYQIYLQNFESTINNLRKDILHNSERTVEANVDNLSDIITQKKSELLTNLSNTVKNRVQTAHEIAENIYEEYKDKKSDVEIKKIITTALKTFVWNNGESFIWIVDYDGVFHLAPKYLNHLVGSSIIDFKDATGRYIIQEEIDIVKKNNEGFIWDTFTKPNEDIKKQYKQIAFVKAFGHYNWYLGSGEYLDTASKKMDKELYSIINTVAKSGQNYVFLLDTNGDLLAHKYSSKFTNKDGKIIDKLAAKTFDDILNIIKDKDKVSYVYDWYNNETNKIEKKYSFIQKIPNTNWIIGSGFFLSDIESILAKEEISMYETYNLRSKYIFYFVIFIIVLSLIISYYISQIIKNSFLRYHNRINDKTMQLTELNELLEQKVINRTAELNELKDNYKKLATTDSLTSMHNRYSIMNIISSEINRSNRYKVPLSIIMYDIDFFKNVNDNYGHDVGDSVLSSLSKLVMSDARDIDIFGRYGGEEFLIILPNTTLENAKEYAERLRKKVEKYSFELVGKITISMGVVEIEDNENIDKIFKRVDDLLYVSKNNGRNTISF
jgi:diguanylate cyclase (GGDEF)-like protein